MHSEENKDYIPEEKTLHQKQSFSGWLDNFWYHYKFHTIAVIFVAIVITVFALQLTTREDYDVHIMYAGGKSISHSNDPGGDYAQMLTSFKRVTKDFDENGEITPQFLNLFVPSEDEIAILEEEGRADVLYPLINSDTDTFETNMIFSSNYYVCFLSDELFREYDIDQGNAESGELYPFLDITEYTDKNRNYEYASERGIYLRSTDFYSLPGIKELPEDTVVCLRVRSVVYGSSENVQIFKNSEEVLRSILSYDIK